MFLFCSKTTVFVFVVIRYPKWKKCLANCRIRPFFFCPKKSSHTIRFYPMYAGKEQQLFLFAYRVLIAKSIRSSRNSLAKCTRNAYCRQDVSDCTRSAPYFPVGCIHCLSHSWIPDIYAQEMQENYRARFLEYFAFRF